METDKHSEELVPRARNYKFHEVPEVSEKFMRLFGVRYEKFHDRLASLLMGRLVVNIVDFDCFLHERFGQYEDDNKSMKDVIRENFGSEAESLIFNLL